MPRRRRAGYQFGNLRRVVVPSKPAVVSFWARLALALRILFDPALAARLVAGTPALEAAPGPETGESRTETPSDPPSLPGSAQPDSGSRLPDRVSGALTLLALLQGEGRLVDFLEQDIASFPDADVGAAARVVHGGCRKSLRSHLELERVRAESEGAALTLEAGFDATAIRLTGNVRGEPPYRGVLRHAGWRVRTAHLPVSAPGHDARVVAAAEVEL